MQNVWVKVIQSGPQKTTTLNQGSLYVSQHRDDDGCHIDPKPRSPWFTSVWLPLLHVTPPFPAFAPLLIISVNHCSRFLFLFYNIFCCLLNYSRRCLHNRRWNCSYPGVKWICWGPQNGTVSHSATESEIALGAAAPLTTKCTEL